MLTEVTTHDDGKSVRTALIIRCGDQGGSIDILDANGKRLAQINLFTNEEADWFAADVIDVDNRFRNRIALTWAEPGNGKTLKAGKLVAADFRNKE